MVVWSEKDINPEQEQAILYDGNVLLVACPGSGKTRTLTYKIANELSALKSEKNFVIAITYTNRAAEEIKDRIELLGIDTDQLWIGTIHSFCLEWILKPYYLYSDDLKNGFKITNAHDTEELLTELCAPYQAQRITHFDCAYIQQTDGYTLSCPVVNKHTYIEEILSQYWEILKQRRQIDFQMILLYSYKLIEDRPFISILLSKIFCYLCLDEYQDTSEIQYAILLRIIHASDNRLKAFIVGDPNQSIYTSLGGYAITKSNLENLTGSKFKEFSLSGNYRSSHIIINYFDYYKIFDTAISAQGNQKDYKSVISYNNAVAKDNLVDEIVRLLVCNIEVEKIAPNEICILAPSWVHLASITRSLMVKLPDYSFDGPGMAPFAKDIDNFFYKLCRIILTEPSPNMYLRRLKWSAEVLFDLETLLIDVSKFTKKKFLKLCNSIVIDETEGIPYLKAFIDLVFMALKFDINSNESLKEHYASFFKSSEKRIGQLVKEGYDAISSVESFKKVFKQKNGITISTIHGAKGAEFDTVIAFALLEGYVPHFSDQDKHDSAKKLLYVICSRAKKNLHLISEKGRLKNYGNPRPEYYPTVQLSSYNYTYEVY